MEEEEEEDDEEDRVNGHMETRWSARLSVRADSAAVAVTPPWLSILDPVDDKGARHVFSNNPLLRSTPQPQPPCSTPSRPRIFPFLHEAGASWRERIKKDQGHSRSMVQLQGMCQFSFLFFLSPSLSLKGDTTAGKTLAKSHCLSCLRVQGPSTNL